MKPGILKINESLSMIGDNLAQVCLSATIPSGKPDEASQKALNAASLWYGETNYGKTKDSVQVPEPQKLTLTEDRYVYKNFRALSQSFLKNRGLDFSRPGVLEKAVELIKGKTIYANHYYQDIDNWRGVVAESMWDAEGKDTDKIPGINITAKVDAFLNYRTACGLMMEPPAINSASVTVISEVEFSHSDLVKNGTFWDHFLKEVDGEIVRLIAINIIEIWEMSFVFLGEDRLAKSLPEEPDLADDETAQTDKRQANMSAATKLNATEKTTMKVTEEQKTLLGITADGDDLPEQTVLEAALELAKVNNYSPTEIAELSLKATQGEKLLVEKRNEVKRLAKLAEFGGDEATLNEVLIKMIDNAGVDDLLSLETDYRKKVSDKFPKDGKSSLENVEEIEEAGGVKKETKQTKTVNADSLHN